MIGEGVDHCYIACATDHRYVPLACVMLSSLDDNGNVPEASVLVGAFGLSEDDRVHIRRSAGRMADKLTFIDLDEGSPELAIRPHFRCPLPLLARFVIPSKIEKPRSRLIMLDVDMIINRSLRPLFETNMRGEAVAAVHDSISWREHYGRPPHPHYFNAGMMMVDTDRFNKEQIGSRAMKRLAAYDQAPMWLDQDAINEVIGERWLPLDRRWNFFHAADYRPFTFEDYAAADIVHYSGPKLWDDPNHPGAPLFFEHAKRVEDKLKNVPIAGHSGLSRSYVAGCYEILLARDLESEEPFLSRANLTPTQFVGTIVSSQEFRQKVFEPITQSGASIAHAALGKPTLRQRLWTSDKLPLLAGSVARLEKATSWDELLTTLMSDGRFMASAEMRPFSK